MKKLRFQFVPSLSVLQLLLVSSGAIALPAFTSIQAANVHTSLSSSPTSLASETAIAALAKHLKQTGAKMYGAYWCPHCQRQKELFGQAVFTRYINYIECDPRGTNPKPALCQAAKIRAYPTWEINGKFYVGVQSLENLAKISGYQGSHAF
jgi:glutaredoxin